MAINHFILVLISLSCLFSFSASSPAPSPASAPFPSEIQSFNFPEPEGQKHEQELTILPVSADPSLQRICGDTDHPIECLTTTVPFLGDDVKIEPVSILKVGLEAMGNKTREALAEASLLLLDPSTQEAVASCLETCIDSYNAILDTNQKAIEAIAIRDLYQLSMELSSNVENVHACSDAFEEAELESPIKEIDALLEKMISNSLAIGIDMVHF